MSETMIKIENLKKKYKLGAIGGTTLTAEIQSWWARKRGKADPNLPIGFDIAKLGKTFWALGGINLEVRKGERLGIIGHNGAGKSTLLKILSRITAPTEGEVGLNGRVSSMLEVGTGFHGELTGRQNIYMNGAILGMSRKEIEAKIEDIIDFSEVREFIDTPVKRYSSGMYVKLGFAVAAHLDSEIMIMDEVLAVGDMAFQKKCLDKMREASEKESRTVLYVSHNMNTIRQLCERVVVLNKGKIVYDGDVEEGIGVYLGDTDTIDDYPVEYSFLNKPRQFHFGKEIFIESLKFLATPTAKFYTNNPMQMQLVISSNCDRDNIQLVFRIKKINGVDKIATTLSEPFSVSKDKKRLLTLFTDLHHITPGQYTITIEVIQFDSYGSYHSYDNPDTLIPIEIIEQSDNKFDWPEQYWGNVKLDTSKIVFSAEENI